MAQIRRRRINAMVNIPDGERKKLQKLLAAMISEMQETSLNPADETIEEDMKVAPPPTKKTALDSILGEKFACANPPNPTKKRTPTLLEQARLEVKAYTALPGILLSSCPFAWWKTQASTFPLLSNFAMFVLGIPATSVPSERVFSSNADKLIFLHHNM
ncbi:hypothetical protein CAPTEDRAFT_187355 [Capitella teleta]|uniref:HAT C-terminal dimerisation domain-containing protein n=1 Tax=Capitella teleta TaxID=283909 RepID=X1ZK60_CAPTE|nr:hypothetical protein CAPTEDRAFT_187355 [Capitella teleta]|eukprot:ELU10182.1 hypothetical protein CAPTEDRAFT_187355 [Capitella teleta]